MPASQSPRGSGCSNSKTNYRDSAKRLVCDSRWVTIPRIPTLWVKMVDRCIANMIFTDAHERSIDDKNRIQIPAPYRNALDPNRNGVALYVVPGERDNTISIYPERFFEDKVASLRTDQIAGDDALDFEQSFFSLSSRVDMDKQGRLVLPERQLEMNSLGKEVYVTGAHYRLDVWRKGDYEAFLSDVSSRRRKLQGFLRLPSQATATDSSE
jgi:transcriptional regulator MraZ